MSEKDLHLVGVMESRIHLQTSLAAGLFVEKSQTRTFVGLVMRKRRLTWACINLVKNEIDLKVVVENGSKIQFCVELQVVRRMGA